MNTINHADLLQLLETPGDRFVSLYMPTYPAGRETPQNPIRFRELLKTADQLLREKGMSATDTLNFLAPATQLLDQPVFWEALGHGLAVLISAQGMRVWHQPFECEELCVVGKRFHITPLVAWCNDNAPYYVLAISQNRARLLHGNHFRLSEIKVPGLPMSRTESLNYHPSERSLQIHSGQPHQGKEGLVFTGQGGEPDVSKQEIAEFFQLINTAVCDFLNVRTEPLVFAGVDYLYPIYREHNHYPHLLSAHISGNPDLLSPLDLGECAWPIIESSLRKLQEAEVAKFCNLARHGRGSNHVADIVRTAQDGAVETLFICPTVRRLGAFDPHTYDVREDDHPRNDSEDLVNLAACFVLKHGGKVEAVASGNIPGGGPMAAAFRYAPAAAPG